jgi:hypothetical protein
MSKKNLSEKIDDILKRETSVIKEKEEPAKTETPKIFLHETVEVILNNRAFNDSLNNDLDLTEDSFKRINNTILKEYVEHCGYPYTTRKQSIQTLFETNKVNQDVIYFLQENQEREEKEKKLMLLAESHDLSLEDEFQTKYGEELDFRELEEKEVFRNGSVIYDKLDSISQKEWEDYINILRANGVQCYYDSVEDCFFVSNFNSEDEIERYKVEPEDSRLIENIIKETDFKLIEVRGPSKTTGKKYVIETIVEKEGYQTLIEYHDTRLSKPWTVSNAQYQFLQEALSCIRVPYKNLITKKANAKKPSLLEKISKQYYNKTDNLPISEEQRRELKAKKLISNLETLHDSDDIIEQLNEGRNVTTSKGTGVVRHIDWIRSTVNINTKKDEGGNSNFISDISFDDIHKIK